METEEMAMRLRETVEQWNRRHGIGAVLLLADEKGKTVVRTVSTCELDENSLPMVEVKRPSHPDMPYRKVTIYELSEFPHGETRSI